MKRCGALVILALAPGCADTLGEVGERHERRLVAVAHEEHKPLSERAKRILILESDHVDQATEVLGIVDVHEPVNSQDEAIAELREHAEELGADAVLGVEFHHGEAGPAPTHLSGLAVRFNDLIKGRPYDVLGDIEGTAPMGQEEEAHRALWRKASALRADLITNVKFDHGEGEGPVRYSGRAIRFRQTSSLGLGGSP